MYVTLLIPSQKSILRTEKKVKTDHENESANQSILV